MCTATKRARSPHQPTGTWIRPAARLAIYLRDGFHCVYCGLDLHNANPWTVTLDHVVARTERGSNAPANLVTACRSCNSARQDTPLRLFADFAARARIRMLTKRRMPKYTELAKALIAGKTGGSND